MQTTKIAKSLQYASASIKGSSPEATFIVLSYNNAPFVRECLESVANQSFSDYEIVIADDGSSDDSAHIIGDFLQKTSACAIALFSSKNAGIVANYNKALGVARGKYIAHIASDDLAERNRLSLQYEALRNSGASMCVSSLTVIDEHGALLRTKSLRDGFLDRLDVGLHKGRIGLPSPTMMYDRKLIEIYGPLPANLFNEDEALGVRALAASGVYAISQFTTRYRRHSHSVTSKALVLRFNAFLKWQHNNIPLRIDNMREYVATLKKQGKYLDCIDRINKEIHKVMCAHCAIGLVCSNLQSGYDVSRMSSLTIGIYKLSGLYLFSFIRVFRDILTSLSKKVVK